MHLSLDYFVGWRLPHEYGIYTYFIIFTIKLLIPMIFCTKIGIAKKGDFSYG